MEVLQVLSVPCVFYRWHLLSNGPTCKITNVSSLHTCRVDERHLKHVRPHRDDDQEETGERREKTAV